MMMSDELRVLREQLCKNASEFCRECFSSSRFANVQNPPNVFRIGRNGAPKMFFVFDKPNDNDSFRDSDLIPITIFDSRRVAAFRNPSEENLLTILRRVGIGHENGLDSKLFYITNAVKCDKCAQTGATGGIRIRKVQKNTCVSLF